MRQFYKKTPAFNEQMLAVGDGHSLNIKEYGNPQGIPIIVNHGGPGGAILPYESQYFDPALYHIITYDQRACGGSTPTASLEANDTQRLIADVEKVRAHILGPVKKVAVFGGSWGATLSILYAQAYPQNVSALFLRGIFLGGDKNAAAFLEDGCTAALRHPEEWQRFKSYIFPEEPAKRRTYQEVRDAYFTKSCHADPAIWQSAGAAFARWETASSCPTPEAAFKDLEAYREYDATGDISKLPFEDVVMGRIEIHYMKNQFFMPDRDILVTRLPVVPIYICTGEQDDVCPPEQTQQIIEWLRQNGHGDNVQAEYPKNTGHSGKLGGNVDALVRFTDHYAKSLAPKSGLQARNVFLEAPPSSSAAASSPAP